MKAHTTRAVKWILYNGIFFTALYFALWHGINGAQNLVKFYVWFAFTVSLLTLIPAMVKETMKDPSKVPPRWWRIFDGLVDVIVVGIFIWFGWWWVGTAYAIHIIFLHTFYSRCDNYLLDILKGTSAE